MKRDVAVLVAGQFVSVVGDGLASIAMLWWVLQATGSAAWMGAVAAVATIGAVAVSPVAGVVVDRLDRRRLMMGTDAVRALLYAALAVLAGAGRLPLWAVFVLLTLARAAGGFFLPALMAALPRLAPAAELQRANGLLSLGRSGGQILGAAAGGVLVAVAGAPFALGCDAISFVASVASLALIAIPPAAARAWVAGARGWAADIGAGLAFVRGEAVVRALIVLSLVLNAIGSAIVVLFPPLAAGPLRAGAQGFGWMEAGVSAGILAGSGLASLLGRPLRRAWAVFAALGATGGAIALLGLTPVLNLAVACTFAAGALIALVNVYFQTLLQRRVPDDMLGRVFSLMGGAGQGLAPLSQAAAGLAATVWSAGAAMLGCGALLTAGAAGFGLADARAMDVAMSEGAGPAGDQTASGPGAAAG